MTLKRILVSDQVEAEMVKLSEKEISVIDAFEKAHHVHPQWEELSLKAVCDFIELSEEEVEPIIMGLNEKKICSYGKGYGFLSLCRDDILTWRVSCGFLWR